MKLTLTISIFLLLLLLNTTSFAQKDIQFEHLTIDNGLSQSSVICILQDSRGFIWFGTTNGLNRYDGYSFKVYKSERDNKNSLGNNYIYSIFEDRENRLWVGTREGGLSLFNYETEEFINYIHEPNNKNSVADNSVRAICEDRSGNLYIGTENGLSILTLDSLKNPQFINYHNLINDTNSLSGNYIRSLVLGRDGYLWIGTFYNGLTKLDIKNKKIIRYQYQTDSIENSNSISSGAITALYEDSEGFLWIGTRGGGLNQFDKEKEIFYTYKNDSKNTKSLSSNLVFAINETKEGKILVGTNGNGLNLFNKKTKLFDRYQKEEYNPKSLLHNSVLSIYIDQAGILWIGTVEGLSKYDSKQKKIDHYYLNSKRENTLSHNWVWSFFEDSKNNLWIGTEAGLNKLNRETNEYTVYKDFSKEVDSQGNIIKAIAEDVRGDLWIGTRNGLFKLDTKTEKFTSYKKELNNLNKLSHNDIRALYFDELNILWIGALDGGLTKFDIKNNKFTNYRKTKDLTSISSNSVWAIYVDTENNMWIGTFGGGLNKFDKELEVFKHYEHDRNSLNSLSDNNVRCIHSDKEGFLWIATSNGLNKLDLENDDFTHYFESDGLPNNVIYGLLADEDGNLWMSTNEGLSKFNPKTKKFKNLLERDGLQSREFNGGSYFKSKRGEMFFGGVNGFNAFLPSSIKDENYMPAVVITKFKIFNKLVDIGEKVHQRVILKKSITETKKIELLHSDYLFSFEFSSLHYSSPERNLYAYKLENFDEDWIFTDSKNRLATYNNLSPGKYIFNVKASNSNGIWNDKIRSIEITILPPFWKTWWFITISIFIIIGSFVLLYWSKMSRVEKQKAMLRLQVELRTKEIAQKNEELKTTLASLQETQSRLIQSEKMASIGILTAGIAHEINNPLNFIQGGKTAIEIYLKEKKNLKKHTDEIMPFLGFIEKGIDRVMIIVKSLNRFNRKSEVQDEKCNLSQIIDNCLIMLQNQMKHKIKLEKKYTKTKNIVLGNEGELHQVFLNILTNSVQAILEEGLISISTEVKNKNKLLVVITDTGEGISTENLKRITDPFFTTKAPGKGTGLGMSISYSILEKLDATIKYESELGKGTSVLLIFNLSEN